MDEQERQNVEWVHENAKQIGSFMRMFQVGEDTGRDVQIKMVGFEWDMTECFGVLCKLMKHLE